MAEGEGTSFENPAYDPYGLGDDDDDEGRDANETTPFFPENSSTPHGKEEEIPMQTMQHEKTGCLQLLMLKALSPGLRP